jgi:uncharacterized protein (TIGR02246 family)
MKQLLAPLFLCASLILIMSCNEKKADSTTTATSDTSTVTAMKPDNAQLKQEIQAIETAYANAQNSGDINAVAAYYANDAVTMPDGMPMMVGNEAIKKDLEEGAAKNKGTTVSYEVLDAFGCENYVTEIGKSTRKDSTGNIKSTGKYMAVWEKRDGKWICIRDIGNGDTKKEK